MQPKTTLKLNHLWYSCTLLVFFTLFPTNSFSQSNNCAATPTLTVGASCSTTNYNVPGTFTESGVSVSCGTSLRDGWYTFTTGASTTSISIQGTSNRRLGLAVYSGACGSLTEVPSACTIPNAANANLTNITVSPNTTYRLRLMRTNGPNSNDMTGTICIFDTTILTNFTCATATSLPCGTSNLAGTTVGSTGSTAHGSGCTMSNYGAWYTFVGDGQLTTITSVAGSGFDHEMSISSGSCGSLTNITCRDSGFTGGTESHTFSTTNGVTYYVYIAHYSDTGTTTGTFTISRSCSAPISNDNCAGAISVPVNPTRTCASTVNGTIFGASDSGVTGSGCGGTDDDDVWYSFVATASTHYIELLNVAGSTTDLYHAVYGGSCGSLGTALVCSDPNTSTVTGLTPGNTYYIQVYSWTSTSGQNTTFDLCVSTDPPCSGTPVAGTATTSPGSGNPGSSYIVSATGFTSNVTGLTFQWQYSTNGGTTWTNAGGATTSYSNYTATAPALGTTVLWQLIVTCTNSGLSATSSNGSFTSVNTINVPASGNNSVTCGTNIALYDNGGSTSNYSNSSDGYTILDAGVGATININGSYSTESSFDYINIYSGSGTGGTLLASYSGSGTINYTGAAGQTLTVEFTSDGSTTYSGFNLTVTYSGSCYTPCSGTPTGGTVSTNPNTGWPGSSYTVSATGMTLALNMTYQWQYSTDGGSTWTNAGASTTSYADYTATAPASGDVHWQLIVTCTNSSQSATSTTGVFVTMSVSDVATGCPNVVSGGLGLSGADPAPFNCTDTSTCVDLEATYLDLGETTDYIVEPILYNPPFAFDGLANPVSVNTDDVWSPLINLPFDFCFYGNTYNQCTIGSNGILSFNTALAGTSSGYSFSNNIPISGDPRLVENSIFGVFHDIDPGVGGEVGWELITLPTGCRALVASWHDVPMFSNNSILYTGMMVLYENSNIIEVYIENKEIDGTWNGGNAVVGIQNSTGTLATVPPGRNGLDTDWTTTNEAWRFVPNGTSIATLTWYEGSGVTGPVVGTTPVLNVCPSSTTTYTAEITYTLCDGTTLTETDETTVTVNGAKVWNGTVNNDWNNNNNWTPTGRPTALDCVVIPPTSNDPVISGTGYNGLGLNMSIQNDATLTVNSDNSVSITDWVNISTTGELVLDNSASLIQTNNIANSGAGNMLMDRDVNIRKLDYVYWSSPVTSFLSSSISPGTSTGLIWKWTPTVSGNGTGNAGNWVNGNEAMTVGKGYIVRGPNTYTSTLQNYTATFVGTPNNGDISIPITRGSYTSGATYQICATCTPATNLDDNWNLVGNPYPSSIDAIDFLTANTTIDGYIKVWTHGTLPSSATVDPFYESYVYNYTVGDYITYNSTGTSSGPGMFNGYIAAGQGFFVSMLDGGPSTKNLNFTNSFRSNTYDNSQFFKNSTNEKHRIWLDIIAPNNNSTRALVGYVSDATYDKDRLFDAKTDNKIDLNLYSLISDETFTIQGRPTPFDENDIVPLGFKVPSTGIYSIGIAALDGLFENTNQAIFIQDLELNIIHDLRSMPYTFNANQGENNTRFNLIYKNSLSTEETINNENNVWVSAFDNLVVNSNNQNIISVKVFDILGRVLTNKTNISNKTVELNELLKTNSGLILEITLENNKVIYKKTIF